MSDRIIHVTAKDFDEAVKKDGLCLVDFWANWCGPCKMLAPVLEEYVASHDDVTVLKVDVDEEEELARKFGVMSIPTLVLYKNGTDIKTCSNFPTLSKTTNNFFSGGQYG